MIKLRKSLPEFYVELEGCKFKLRPFSEVELEQFNHFMIDVYKARSLAFAPKAIEYCLDNCLIDWSGVCDEEGQEIPYKKGDEKYLSAMKVRSVLVAEVFNRSIITEDEKKS